MHFLSIKGVLKKLQRLLYYVNINFSEYKDKGRNIHDKTDYRVGLRPPRNDKEKSPYRRLLNNLNDASEKIQPRYNPQDKIRGYIF
jgi:hypothetical protein